MRQALLFLVSALVLASPGHAQSPADTLQDVRPFGTHALELLTNREPGVEVISSFGAPGMSPTVHVRGLSVLPGIVPVYVVDGIRRRSLEGIAPESIEKIEVLKNASALGLWGADAAAGVVVVTTSRASRKGFHAGYDFTGGFQSLDNEPERLTLDEWRKYIWWPIQSEKEASVIQPENSFLQNHHIFVQYGGERLSAYADFSMLDNDGPYAGRVDTHRRYAASWSVEYRPLEWLSLETTGRWGQSRVGQTPKGWLQSYLVSVPNYEYQYADTQRIKYTNQRELSETVVQGRIEIRPLPGLYVRGTGGYSQWNRPQYNATWFKDKGNVSAVAGFTGGKWYHWMAEAGWSGTWRGHRLGLDATFRRMKEKQDIRILGGNTLLADYGLTYGDDEHLEEKYLLPAYDKYLAAGGGTDGFVASKLGMVEDHPSEPDGLKWKEGVLRAAYDYRNRIRAEFSYYRMWEEKLSKEEGYGIPAVTLGFNPWKSLSIEASWARPVRSYIPIFQQSLMDSPISTFSVSTATLGASHRDLNVSYAFPLGNAVLDLSGAWFINDDTLANHERTGITPFTAGQTVNPDDLYYSLRKAGVELSAALRGKAGAIHYAVDGHLTVYRNRLSFGEALEPNIEYRSWAKDAPRLFVKDGESVGGRMYRHLYPQGDGVQLAKDSKWGGNTFPTITGGLRASLGWNQWQFTVSGHGAGGQTILHANSSSPYQLDALTRYYLETIRDFGPKEIVSSAFNGSEWSILDAGFFRIDQIRLDYGFPLRYGVRMNLYASLENGFLFSPYGGSDPELALAWDGLGVETATYPSTSRLLFGIGLTL